MINKKCEIYNVSGRMYVAEQEHFPNIIVFEITWNANIGFGVLNYVYNTKTKEWGYDSECMGEEFCKEVLNKWIEGVSN